MDEINKIISNSKQFVHQFEKEQIEKLNGMFDDSTWIIICGEKTFQIIMDLSQEFNSSVTNAQNGIIPYSYFVAKKSRPERSSSTSLIVYAVSSIQAFDFGDNYNFYENDSIFIISADANTWSNKILNAKHKYNVLNVFNEFGTAQYNLIKDYIANHL